MYAIARVGPLKIDKQRVDAYVALATAARCLQRMRAEERSSDHEAGKRQLLQLAEAVSLADVVACRYACSAASRPTASSAAAEAEAENQAEEEEEEVGAWRGFRCRSRGSADEAASDASRSAADCCRE